MPQPLSSRRYPPGANIVIGGGTIHQKPELASVFFRLLVGWAAIESQLGIVFVRILGEDARDRIDRFIARASTRRYQEILLEEAASRVNHEDLASLRIIVSMYLSVFEMRNKLAHWCSGTSPQIQNAILLTNPHEYWRFTVAFEEYLRTNPGGPRPDYNRRKIFVYEARDFAEMLSDFRALERALFCIAEVISFPHGITSTLARDRLYAIPQFQKAKEVLVARGDPKKAKSLQQRLSRLLRQLSFAFREFFQAR
jgi:hypothetical protein